MSGKVSDAVVGGEERGTHARFSKKLIVLVGAALVLVGGGIYFYLSSRQDVNPATSKAAQQTIDQAVNKSVQHPDYARAKKELNNQLKATKDNAKRADLYISLVSIALQQAKYQEVIDNENLAIQANPAREGEQSATLADAYLHVGNKAEALKYYQKALSYYQSKPDNFSGRAYFISTIRSKIAELSK